MGKTIVCPFYGKNDDYCDVGCGYISTHDVNMIIRYCSGRYGECVKYLELVDRFPCPDKLDACVNEIMFSPKKVQNNF